MLFSLFLFTITFALAAPSPDPTPPATATVSDIQSTEIFDLFTYPARAIPLVNTTVLAESDGLVSKIHAPLGQRVNRGQAVATITHTDPVYQYAPVVVRAPVQGVVSALEITEGTQVSKGQKLGSVTDPSKVRIQVEVPAGDARALKKGIRGEFKLTSSFRDEVVPVQVRGVSPFIDSATGTASAELEITDTKRIGDIPPGSIGQVVLKANPRKSILIPEHAVTYKGDKTFVHLLEEGKAKMVAVHLGRRQRDQVEVTQGLKLGTTLIERTSRHVADGDPVTKQEKK